MLTDLIPDLLPWQWALVIVAGVFVLVWGLRKGVRLARWLAVFLGLLVMAGAAMLVGPNAPAAEAAPVSVAAQPTDCKEAPDPEFPGAGVVGDLDPPDANQGVPGGVYHELGYGGQVWHTYDLGCGPDAAVAPEAVTDTWLGNLLFDAAKLIVSASIAVNDSLIENGVLDKLDELLVSGTISLYEGVFLPLVGLALAILGVFLLLHVFRGQLAVLSKRAMIAVIALGVASATYLTPVFYTQLIDNALVGAMQQIRSGVLSGVDIDPRYALPEVLHTEVVWEGWLAGEFGSASSNPAQVLGRDLVRSQSFTRDEVKAGQTGEDQANAKKAEFEEVASRLSPASYPYLTGESTSRVGSGAFALAESVVYGGFQLMANVVAFVCLLLIRVLVLLAPVLGLIAILRGQTLMEMLRAGGAAIWHALYLTVIATVHLASMVFISGLGLPGMGTLLLMVALSVVLWWIAGPWRRLRSMVTAAAAVAGQDIAPAGARRLPFGMDELWEKIRQRTDEVVAPVLRRSEGFSTEPVNLPSEPVSRPGVGAPAPVEVPVGAGTAGQVPAPVGGGTEPDASDVSKVASLARYRAQRSQAQVYVPPPEAHRNSEEDR